MSLNTLHPATTGELDLTPGERLLTGPHEAEIEVRIPPTLAGPKRSLKGKGSVLVTDQRVLFLAALPSSNQASAGGSSPPAYDDPPLGGNELRSLAIPYTTLLSSGFELPIFSQNYISLTFLPDPSNPSSNFPSLGRGSDIKASLWVGEGAGHGVWKRIEGERQATAARRDEGEMLPAYSQ